MAAIMKGGKEWPLCLRQRHVLPGIGAALAPGPTLHPDTDVH